MGRWCDGWGRRAVVAVVGVASVATVACVDQGTPPPTMPLTTTTTTTSVEPEAARPAPPDTLVVATAGGGLVVWAAQPEADGTFRQQRLVVEDGGTPEEPVGPGRAVGHVCPVASTGAGRLLLVGDDGSVSGSPGWVFVRVDGERVGDLSARAVGALRVPLGGTGPRPVGCAVLEDGRIATTTTSVPPGEGDPAAPGPGEVLVWFPGVDDGPPTACKIDLAALGAGAALARPAAQAEDLLVATAGGVARYRGPLPTSADPAGGCAASDALGVPTALVATDAWPNGPGVDPATTTAVPGPVAGLAAVDRGVLVARELVGSIDEVGDDGARRRSVLEAPPGEVVGPVPRLGGTPVALAVDVVGTLYYADSGRVTAAATGDRPVLGPRTGTVRRIRFEAGEPLAPDVLGAGLDAPEGVAVLAAGSGGGGSTLLVP